MTGRNPGWEWLVARLGGRFPDNFVAFDVETTGLDRKWDYVWQFGYARCKGGKVLEEGQVLFDWARCPTADFHHFEERALMVIDRMRSGGRPYRLDFARLRSEGVPPPDGFRSVATLLQKVHDDGGHLVAHNADFDLGFVRAGLLAHARRDLPEGCRVLDTLALEQIRASGKPPAPGEGLDRYVARMARGRAVKAKLTPDCFERYGFGEKYGCDLGDAHDALFDARVTAWLMFEYAATGAAATDAAPPRGSAADKIVVDDRQDPPPGGFPPRPAGPTAATRRVWKQRPSLY